MQLLILWKGRDISTTAIFEGFPGRWQENVRNILDFVKKTIAEFSRFLYRSRKIIISVSIVVLLTIVISSLLVSWFSGNENKAADNLPKSYTQTNDGNSIISTTGTLYLEGLEIYGGDLKTQLGKPYIDWGELGPGASRSVSFYVKSTSNSDVELGLNASGWTPAGVERFISLSWNQNGTKLIPQQELLVRLNLHIASSDELINFFADNQVQTFGFDITIVAIGL